MSDAKAVTGETISSEPAAPPRVGATTADVAARYAERHTAMENYIASWHVVFALLSRAGVDPRSLRGRVLNFAIVLLLLALAPIGVSAATGDLHTAPIVTWIVVAALFAVIASAVYGPLRSAVDGFLSLHRLMVDEPGIRELVEWDRRWFTVRASVPIVTVFAVAMLALLLQLDRWGPQRLPSGTVVVAALLLFEVGEVLYTVVMLGLESRILERHRYALYHLGPADTVGLRRSMRGSNRMAVLVGLVATLILVAFGALLADQGVVVGIITLVLLVISYAAIGFGVLLPRLAMLRIIVAEKERHLATWQARIDELLAVTPSTEEVREELEDLKERHDALRDSSQNVLPVSSIGQVLSSLVLPTLTFFFTEAGNALVGRALHLIGFGR